MNYYYITGTSRGIGRAMVEYLLSDERNHVTGISRSGGIKHERYRHIPMDLSDPLAVKEFRFETHKQAQRICLINNAGAIGQVKPAGRLSNEQLIADFNLNLVAPGLLMNNFIAAYRDVAAEKIIVNVSSGAGKYPIDGWSVYCSAKAGLDMFSRVVDAEQKTTAPYGFRVFAIAPGVVETQMQTDIRQASREDFSRLSDFINYKSTGQLADPRLVAEKYFHILANQNSIPEVVLSVKDY
ncbi:MAG: SDR family NAD(P)-dependent oxidoreductase [Bacteroidota bacterium]